MKTKRIFYLALVLTLSFISSSASASPPTSSPVPAALSTTAGWRWPLNGEPKILEPFDKPAQNWLPGHRGVDLAASEGAKVLAPQRGKVTFTSKVVDRPVVVIDHGGGFKTSIEPVTATVMVGDIVDAGDQVGTVATGAHCSGRCIHWGVRLNGEYVDPVLLIRDMRPSILLPLHH
ncbi:M23 family metallopeptidase [Glutamicibacter sp. JC586]|uniref:M23 family metallopeptidase n=1 Tax=Glutamicibacter sp. JC586 TaxID=2590552 RepID=UPI001F316AE7|nr:M23 family metallopeptidase [Glutamicibacter sp. JC586]